MRPDTVTALIFWPGPAPLLSDVSKMFENFDLRLASVKSSDSSRDENAPARIQVAFRTNRDWRKDDLRRLSEAFEAHSSGRFVIDDYARLIASADTTWRNVELIRAACRFVRQTGLVLSEIYLVDTLVRYPAFVAALIEYFEAKFDPAERFRDDRLVRAQEQLASHIDSVSTLYDDRILRSLRSFVSACVRTNWYQSVDGAPKRYSAFKLNSRDLFHPGPVIPYREIFVHADDMEGIHARSGAVARGGLRFSDRPEDYRIEVLGLMKTQQVKNSPIVPVGAKGAFVRKNTNVTPQQAYSTFISGLLDVTDNIVDGIAVHPADTVVHEPPDAYLVVAADKGTASFSDLANSLARTKKFWLGDGFASGGSRGYDHKAMGITARGAWSCVRRHFETLRHDIDREPTTVVGIGDMSGDVFGNGMLLSRSLRLIAAFDHRHIFIDPDPDESISYEERRRLFVTPGSSWADYNRDAISPGGGIWERSSAQIQLSSPARKLLEIDEVVLSPDAVIRAILAAPVDLRWNGGIGTYIKATIETHREAADPANDAVRINADQLRCRVVGEGGNLGLTQRARVEYALAGGHVNADFIDNAAGVATSDLEVNSKIALDAAVTSHGLSPAVRDAILADATDEVAASVLQICENQSLAISLAESNAPRLLNRHERHIENLEVENGIDRSAEFLPTVGELTGRAEAGRGLTRPEIAVLLALSKNIVKQELLSSNVPDDAQFYPLLGSYFPAAISARIGDELRTHPLAREIVATELADDLVNHVGPGLIHQLEERLGVTTPAVARAYTVIRDVFDVDTVWTKVIAREDISSTERLALLRTVQQFIEHTASWILRRRPPPIDIAAEISRYKPRIRELIGEFDQAATVDETAERLSLWTQAFDLIETAQRRGVEPRTVSDILHTTDAVLHIGWVIAKLDSYIAANRWESVAAATTRDALVERQHVLVGSIVGHEIFLDDELATWQRSCARAIQRLTAIVAQLRRDDLVDISRACAVVTELDVLIRETQAPPDQWA
ncbi:NAD-glutamate dehydrogenase [Rhodococcus enclensis]|nr:NAD-glutamate dehydrogenase [Rhodococcus qingshengii]